MPLLSNVAWLHRRDHSGARLTGIGNSDRRIDVSESGSERDRQRRELEDAGLSVTVSEQESDKPENEVLTQNPNAGTEVEEGATVSIVV